MSLTQPATKTSVMKASASMTACIDAIFSLNNFGHMARTPCLWMLGAMLYFTASKIKRPSDSCPANITELRTALRHLGEIGVWDYGVQLTGHFGACRERECERKVVSLFRRFHVRIIGENYRIRKTESYLR